jgi:hypothetical protein
MRKPETRKPSMGGRLKRLKAKPKRKALATQIQLMEDGVCRNSIFSYELIIEHLIIYHY